MATIIDSYSENNQSAQPRLNSDGIFGIGQSFSNTNANTLDSCKFYLKKGGSPTGNAVAKIYAHSGTYGTSSIPTGSSLATSDNFDVSNLSTSFGLKIFSFSGVNRISLSASTNYVITVEYNGGDADNYVSVGNDNTSPTAGGNYSQTTDGINWGSSATQDVCFYVYGTIVGPFPTYIR